MNSHVHQTLIPLLRRDYNLIQGIFLPYRLPCHFPLRFSNPLRLFKSRSEQGKEFN
jgi:hypothetical protein